MSDSKIMIGMFVAVVALLGIFAFASSAPNTKLTLPQSIDNSGAVATGPGDAPVTLVEFADFQCPACGSAHPTIQKILADFPGKIRYIHRHYPLRSIHPNAQAAAIAAEAAKAQDKFWEMHNMLFTKQSEWTKDSDPSDDFLRYAKQIGLDETKFTQDIKNNVGSDAIERDIKAGDEAGVSSTPTFFVNGQGLVGVPDYTVLKAQIEALLPAN